MEVESAEGIRSVVLRRSESSGMGLGLGFSIMGGAGHEFPPVIYGIEKDSPAARAGTMEAGDIILSINEREVVKLSTKEVLKILRLSGDIVHIKFKRDPHVVSRVRQFLAVPNHGMIDNVDGGHNLGPPPSFSNTSSPVKQQVRAKTSQIPVYQYPNQQAVRSPSHKKPSSPNSSIINSSTPSSNNNISFKDDVFINHTTNSSNHVTKHSPNHEKSSEKKMALNSSKSFFSNEESFGPPPTKNGRKNFEAFVMTGDKILNLSRNDTNSAFRHSPTKTTSKLTPMPQMPVFVEREKDLNRRLKLEKQRELEASGGSLVNSMKTCFQHGENDAEPGSPPLPPPPDPLDLPPSEASQANSNSTRSDSNLPLPPPPDDMMINGPSNDIGDTHETKCALPSPNTKYSGGTKSNRNNHRTSTSSNNNNNHHHPHPTRNHNNNKDDVGHELEGKRKRGDEMLNKNLSNEQNSDNNHSCGSNNSSQNDSSSNNVNDPHHRVECVHMGSESLMNNEDTSISSSVMSDDEGGGGFDDDELELIETEDEEVIEVIEKDQDVGNGVKEYEKCVVKVSTKKTKLRHHFEKKQSSESNSSAFEQDGEEARLERQWMENKKSKRSNDNGGNKSVPEKERYNEYILLNGENRGVKATNGDRNEHLNHSSSDSSPEHGSGKPGDGSRTASTISARVSKDRDGMFGSKTSDSDESCPSSPLKQGCTRRNGTEGKMEDGNTGVGKDRDSGSGSGGGDSDSSDVESVRVAPVVKAVDLPSAERLAKRLYSLDGFKASDVWRQLSKSNDFSRAVATEYLNFFNFTNESLDVALRKFLEVCPLRGETQERERVLSYFSQRYVDCNQESFGSQDSVHTLACALMLLNTDMYSGVRTGRRMTCMEFIENLSGLNDGEDFPKNVLKQLYHSIKGRPLVSAMDSDDEISNREVLPVEPPVTTSNIEFKRGYLMRKSVFEPGGKKTPLGKRSWKMFFCRLKELVYTLSPDETSKATIQNTHSLKLHHCIAAVASDYKKRPHVFRLTLADRSQYLFQSSDAREMNSWIDMINWNTARFSCPALEPPCSSSGRFEKPVLPSSVTRMTAREQLSSHQNALSRFEEELDHITKMGKSKKDAKEKLIFFQFEIRRYRSYVDVLEKRMASENLEGSTNEELVELQVLPNPPAVLLEVEENS